MNKTSHTYHETFCKIGEMSDEEIDGLLNTKDRRKISKDMAKEKEEFSQGKLFSSQADLQIERNCSV